MSDQEFVSLMPSSYTQGGLIDDQDVTLVENRFVLWNYNREDIPEVPALKIKMVTDDGEEHEDYLSAGDAKFFVPTDDGERLRRVGSRSSLNANSNMATFLKSMIEIGLDETKLDGPISVLDGIKVHIRRVAQKKRAGLQTRAVDANGQERVPTVLTVTDIHSFPWENDGKKAETKPAKASGGKKASTKKAEVKAAAGGDEPLSDEDLAGMVVEILGEKGGSASKAELVQAMFQKTLSRGIKGPAQKAATKRVYDESGSFLPFFEAIGKWTVDGDTIKLPE